MAEQRRPQAGRVKRRRNGLRNQPFRFFRGFRTLRSFRQCRLFWLVKYQYYAGGTELGEVVLEQVTPEGSALQLLQLVLQDGELVAGQVLVAEAAYDALGGIIGALHHHQEQAVVLGDGLGGNVLLVNGYVQARA